LLLGKHAGLRHASHRPERRPHWGSADMNWVWRNRDLVQIVARKKQGGTRQNAQAPLASMPLLMASASTKVGTVSLTISKLPGHGMVGMPWSQIWQKPVSDQRIR